METPDRRRVLRALGAAGAAATLAGCSDDGQSGPDGDATATEPPESPYVTDDGRIDYPGMVGGAATVNPDGDSYTIEYEDPSRGFVLRSGFEGDTDPAELRVSRDMTVDARAGFVAPIYDGNADEFVYQVFANESYVEYADWQFVTVDANEELAGEGAVPFERVEGTVHAAGVSPGDVRRLFVVDRTARELREDGPGSLSGIVVLLSTGTTGN